MECDPVILQRIKLLLLASAQAKTAKEIEDSVYVCARELTEYMRINGKNKSFMEHVITK